MVLSLSSLLPTQDINQHRNRNQSLLQGPGNTIVSTAKGTTAGACGTSRGHQKVSHRSFCISAIFSASPNRRGACGTSRRHQKVSRWSFCISAIYSASPNSRKYHSRRLWYFPGPPKSKSLEFQHLCTNQSPRMASSLSPFLPT